MILSGVTLSRVTMVRWLVIGIGDLTTKRVITGILAEPRSEFYGVVTRDLRKAEAYPGVRAWTSLDDALKDDAVDAVYVVSPVSLHAPQTIASFAPEKRSSARSRLPCATPKRSPWRRQQRRPDNCSASPISA